MNSTVTAPGGRNEDLVTENQNKIPAANEPQPEKSAKNKLMAPPTVPWDQPVEGHVLLDALVSQFKRHLSLPDGATDAMALWVVFTHAFDAMYVNPRLSFISPAPGCGKTTALSMLKCLVSKPVMASNITPAVVFRIIEQYQPTLLADEADTYLQDRDGLRGILNSGHTKAGASILRSMGDNHEPTAYSTWAPMAIAKIGKLHATLHDRSIVIKMQRALRNEKIEKFWGDDDGQLNMLARKAARWASHNLQKLRGAEPQVPGDLLNRAADNWLPLLAIADAVGGHWPERARLAAVTLTGKQSGDESELGIMLLRDIKRHLDVMGHDRLTSDDLCNALTRLEDRPWGDYKNGRAMSRNQLANILSPFGIRPSTHRFDEKLLRGYLRADFEDAFARYLQETATPQQVSKINDLEQESGATSSENVADQPEPKSLKSIDCCGVADEDPGPPMEDVLSAMDDKIPG